MSALRLTTAHRDAMVATIISQRFKAEVEAEWPRWAAIAKSAYDRLYDQSTQRKMKALPEGWLPRDDGILVRLGAETTRLKFSGALTNCHRIAVKDLAWPAEVRFRFQIKHIRSMVLSLEATDEISIAYARMVADHTGLQERINDARAQVRGTLDSFSTSTALLEAWPEVAPFLPSAAVPRQAIAIRRADLNALLKLPADGVAA